ncbi:MAG: DUF4422 domain-containing protein [Roseburia sp.]
MNKIYVATHKPFTPPQDSFYVPIQVNAAKNPSLGFCTDNTGENISDKNYLYGELTALYWIWKNECSADYIGLCHYRRYFLNHEKKLLTSDNCDDIFKDYDIILPYQTICPGMNYYEMYQASHNIEDVKTIESIIARLYPEYLLDYQNAIHGNLYYMGNLFMTSRELFCEYAEWLFTIFEEAEKVIDISGYDQYHARVYGFLSEQMLMAWVKHNHLRICELEVKITSEKIETSFDIMERIEELEHEYPNHKLLLEEINILAMQLHDVGNLMDCLKLLQYALSLDSTDSTTLRHVSVVCSELNSKDYTMNVVIATNRRYVPVSLVMLYSLFANNANVDIHVYIMHCELIEEDNAAFQKLASAWKQTISLVPLTDLNIFAGLPTTDAWTKETYFRLLISTLLPKSIDRILYLDVDTIVNGPIQEFYLTDFEGMDLVVCEDIKMNRVYKNSYYRKHFKEMKETDFTYFNAGVILWNMSNIRAHYTFQVYRDKLLEYLNVLQCMDQDILNVIHCGKTKTVDFHKYNLPVPIAIQNGFTYDDVKKFSRIIHFLGPKPWNPDVEFHELYQIWKDYESMLKQDSLT